MASHGRLAAAWIIGILSLGVHPTAAQADLPALEILPNGEMQTKPISSSIVFRCRSNVNSDLISNMQWIDPQGRVIESRGNLTIHTELHEDRSLSLFFNSLQESQAGTYTCEATYSNTKLTKSVKIDTIEAITWENAPEHQRAIKGQNFTIMCKVRARPSPSIDWLYNGTLLKTQDRYIVDAHGLTIQNIQESDDRYYTCRASVPTTGELKEREIHVEVLIRPTIKEISAPIEVIEGESARIECEASGKPPPQITWVKSLTKQNLSMSEGFGVDPDKGVLTITTVNRKDAGEYQCIASNTAGSATTTIVVNVIVKPKIIEFPNSTVAQGDEVNMECRAFGRPPPQVMFRKHTAEKAYILGAQPDDNRLVLKNQMDNVTGETLGILNIRDVRRSNDGLYECIAQNAGGMAFKNGHLTVEFPPSFASMPNDTVAWSWDQRPVNLTCTADSIPNATITWTTQGENSVKNIPHIQQIGNGPTSVLTIHPLDKKFYTYYKCIAVNKHGSKERVFELREASKPGELLQAKIVEMTATTIKFDLILPPTFTDLPIKTVVVQYKEERENWASAKNKSWSANSTYVLSDLKPQTAYDFRFAAMNDVGLGNWNQFLRQTTPGRSFPNEPKIVTKGEEYDVSSFSNQYEVKWLAPPDNGEPIDMYMIKYCQIKRVDRDWETLDNCRTVEVKSSGRLKQWLKDLQPDTFYSVEVRAHNIMGFSKPGSAKFKTAVGIDTKVMHHEGPLISSAAIIGIVIAVLFIIIVIIDVICCCAHKTGIIYYVCERSKRKPVDEEDAKLGRDEKEPLKEEKKITPIIDSGLRRETSVTFDGKRSVSKTGFVGKDSAV